MNRIVPWGHRANQGRGRGKGTGTGKGIIER